MPEAEALRDSISANDRDEKIHGPKLDDCITQYLASREHELGAGAHYHHELLLSRLKEYCERRGKFSIRELNVDLLERFTVEGLAGLKDTTKAMFVKKLRCFLRHAYRWDWIDTQLVDKMKTHAAIHEQKDPYGEEDVTRILEEAGAFYSGHGPDGYSKHPKTFQLLLKLMHETGMRVGDAVYYDPAKVRRGKDARIWIYDYTPQKQKKIARKKPGTARLSDDLKRTIDACDWMSKDKPFAYGGLTASRLAWQVWRCMRRIGKRIDIIDCRPHRLRDTFAVRMLLRGVPLEDVSRLLGHSSVQITEMYYAKWIPARENRLDGLFADALVNT